MVGVAVILEEEGAAGVGSPGTLDTLCDGPGSCGGSGTLGEAGRRFWTSGTGAVVVDPLSTGMRVASTGGLVCSAGFWTGDLGAGGGMDGRMGFSLRTGGVSCYRCGVQRDKRWRIKKHTCSTWCMYPSRCLSVVPKCW